MNKKRIISAILSVTAMLSMVNTLHAEALPNPTVMVDGTIIGFDDQEPVISENNDTLIPVRGVLEAMGAYVEWEEEQRSVYVKASDNIVRLRLFIDNPVMKKYTLKTITTVDSEDITLSTPPTIMNDRTMVPLRVISENINAQVDWDEDKRLITIKTKEYQKYIAQNTPQAEDGEEAKEYNPKDYLPYLYLKADKTEVKKGDVVTVDMMLGNADKIEGGLQVAGVTATLFYDDEKLTSNSSVLVINGEEATNALSGSNPEYRNDSVKYVAVVMPTDTSDRAVSDGAVARFTFTVDTDEHFEISIANRITPIRGTDTNLLLTDAEYNSYSLENYDEIYIDTTPLAFN